jgi:hypothetical protein
MSFEYDMAADQLVLQFWSVVTSAAKVTCMPGISRYELEDRLTEAHYLRGVVLARLRGATPLFRPEMTVIMKRGAKLRTNHRIPCPQRGCTYTVSRVWYIRDTTWALSFQEFAEYPDYAAKYPASCFDPVHNPPSLRLVPALF